MSSLPINIQNAYGDIPDWAENISFAKALEWVALRVEERPVTAEWLRAYADDVYDMVVDDWEDHG